MSKKEGVFLVATIFLLTILVLTPTANATLGMSPAKISMDFVPGFERTFEFTVSSDNPDQEIELYTRGDLEDSVKINKKFVEGSERFKVTIKLPEEIEEPGNHRILIGAREEIDQELASTVGTSLAVQAVIEVFVPYPGKYLELDYEAEDVNAGEQSKFLLNVENKGKQNVTFTPRIEIYGKDDEIRETLNMKTRDLATTESIKLQKILNTTDYEPGEYLTKAIVDYEGKTASENETLNIGHLFVNITDYKKGYTLGKIKEFKLEAESRWNEKIDGVYADITILKNKTTPIEFRTSPVDLEPWERKNISGYFESEIFPKGEYETTMELSYQGETTSKEGKIIFKEEEGKGLETKTILMILGALVLLVIAILIARWLIKKNKK